MASISEEVSATPDDEVESSSLENKPPVENEEVEQLDKPKTTSADEEKKEEIEEPSKVSTSASNELEEEPQSNELSTTVSDLQEEPQSTDLSTAVSNGQDEPSSQSTSSKETRNEDNDRKPREQEPTSTKSRSVNFASTVDDSEVSKPRSNNTRSSYSRSSRRPVDFIDTLVESYKLETSNSTLPLIEEKKYVPKTNRTRLNPNWREHRTRRLMNKLEALSLWDREEELKSTQAQSLREQKWEQIQDRQRNNDLCLNLMRQRHESEMESAVVLDRAASSANDENRNATIAQAMNILSPASILAYDLPTPPHTLKRRVKREQEKSSELKTPIGRYRQFETKMDDKVDKINQKLKPDHEIMRAYSPYRTSIPPTAVPLFSETYSALLAIPDAYSPNKYNQYHYGVASYLHQPQHTPSPDYETRARSYSNRDVRVPLKEQANDYNYYDDDNNNNTDEYSRSNPVENDYRSKYRSNLNDDDDYHPKYRSHPVDDDYYGKYRSSLSSNLDYSPPRRTTSLASPTASSLYDYTTVANTPREHSFIHARQPVSHSIHQRTLNDDLNAITRFSTETSKKILQHLTDEPNDYSTRTRSSSSIPTGRKHVSFHDHDFDDENWDYSKSSSRNYLSKGTHQPVEILSLSSTR